MLPTLRLPSVFLAHRSKLGLVVSSGVTLHDVKRFSASVRLRAFGPRDLTSDGIYQSKATVLLNAVGFDRLHDASQLRVEWPGLKPPLIALGKRNEHIGSRQLWPRDLCGGRSAMAVPTATVGVGSHGRSLAAEHFMLLQRCEY